MFCRRKPAVGFRARVRDSIAAEAGIQIRVIHKKTGNVGSASGLKFSFQNKTIVISRRPPDPAPAAPPADASPEPPSDLHGRVTDSAGNPLAGASVVVKGTKQVFSTNDRGDFILKGVTGPAELVVSYIGYEPKEMTLSGKEAYTVGIQLRHNNSPLDDVMVIGYGTTTRRLSTGSVSKVSTAAIEEQPVSNPILALEGSVPGLFITQTAGYEGANLTVTIRGQNTGFPDL
jgi:hypothetical protein